MFYYIIKRVGIMNNNKNIFDKFLDKYDELSSKKKVNVEAYYRPSICLYS